MAANAPDEDEIAGLIEIGMGCEALAAAGKLLEMKSPTPGSVMESIRAIGVFASSPARWKSRVETFLSRLSKRDRHRMRESFLIYFATIGEHERAVEFVEAPGSFSPESIYLAVTSLLEIGRVDDARRVILKARFPGDREHAMDFTSGRPGRPSIPQWVSTRRLWRYGGSARPRARSRWISRKER